MPVPVGCVGFMGGASSLGLGLALARPERRVIVFDGDGSLLMQLGSLATIAGARPRNLLHLLFKNGVYHTSGSQEIPGGLTVDFVTMARGAGIGCRGGLLGQPLPPQLLHAATDRIEIVSCSGLCHQTLRAHALTWVNTVRQLPKFKSPFAAMAGRRRIHVPTLFFTYEQK